MNPTSKTQTPESESSQDSTPQAGATDKSEAAVPAALKEDASAAAGSGDAALLEVVEADDRNGLDDDLDDDDLLDELDDEPRHSGLGSASTAILSLALGITALTGTWTSRVLSEREQLNGQIKVGQTGTAEQQISEVYGDAWHATAAVNGVVSLVALLIGAIVLALPQRSNWVRPVALAGAVLGFLGLLVSVGMYFDLFASLPVPPPPAAPTAP